MKYAQYLAAQIPQSELRILDGAGHMLVTERIVEVAGSVEQLAA